MKRSQDTTTARIVHSVRRRLGPVPSNVPAFRCDGAKLTNGHFVLLGDLQRTSLFEIWRESNDRARKALVAAVAATNPDFVALLGDLVFQGDSTRDWAELDELLAPVRARDVPVLPVLGNHDYGLRPKKALPLFGARFPGRTAITYYAVGYGRISFVFLDSNRRRLQPGVWDEQLRWYDAELRKRDDDPACRAVYVLVHHPPFTNSAVTGDDANVRESFVPPFLAAKKTQVMFSGHVHSYERFVRGAKAFVVAGGGGAPRVRLREGTKRRHDDDVVEAPLVRPLHYLAGRLTEHAVLWEARGLTEETGAFTVLDRFENELV